eukprot:TRINITY_DN30613_c0_g1_i1.p1 TRINITY_DN30613_c0_g1~~TRINITY_DN30613_c0_g1_i1.p1  ORF type:complete len:356 (+),score=68.40 TRINITY_DN30613_c0_g1_i1:60-1127(+)
MAGCRRLLVAWAALCAGTANARLRSKKVQNTDSRDCQTCQRLTFCDEFTGKSAADCQGDDEEEDAEDKWEGRVGDTCNAAAYKQLVCVRKMDPCDSQGKVVSTCRSACTAAKRQCEGRGVEDATRMCKRFPEEQCWDVSFATCGESCRNLDLCSMFNNVPSTNAACDERTAVTGYEAFINHDARRFTAACPKAFFTAYLCHSAVQPCVTKTVHQRPCFHDCWRFKHHCMGHTASLAEKLCSTHAEFYCDNIARMVTRTGAVDPSFWKESDGGGTFDAMTQDLLIIGVLVLCLIQVVAFRIMGGAASRPDLLLRRLGQRAAGLRRQSSPAEAVEASQLSPPSPIRTRERMSASPRP